jgi:3'(2'), 5'-bisphosphate nucleotidase
MNVITPDTISALIKIARCAGESILTIYNLSEDIDVQLKADQSPVTIADTNAHHILVKALSALMPIPIISEEAELPAFSERQGWSCYWLIDPLDGTKEFIARNGEFTVNIALIENGVPLVGIVHLPVSDETYVGVDKKISSEQKTHAEKYREGKKISTLKTRDLKQRFAQKLSLDVLASHRHGGDELRALLEKVSRSWSGPLHISNAGSSLKFCRIAEGLADFYPRLAPTCEWDTAAAQAVLVAAGGMVVNADTFTSLTCNSSESLLNPSFFALGDATFQWLSLLSGSCSEG